MATIFSLTAFKHFTSFAYRPSQGSSTSPVPEEKLGEGVYGEVWASIDSQTGSPIVKKKAKLGEDPFYNYYIKQALQLEQRMLVRAQHPHVVGYRKNNGSSTLILDRLVSDVYQTYLEKNHSLTAYQTITIGRQLLEALAPFHEKRLIHRDLKPQNISYNEETNQLKLFDFGLAQEEGIFESDLKPQTRDYRAPEVFKSEEYDQRIDIWSVGCILFELYTGRVLFSYSGRDDASFCLSRIHEQLTSCDLFGTPVWKWRIRQAASKKGLSNEEADTEATKLIDLIAPMLKINPEERIQAAEALALPSFRSDINFTLQTDNFGPFHFHLFDAAKYQEGDEIPIDISTTSPSVPCMRLASRSISIIHIHLNRPTSLQKNRCLHAPVTATNSFVVEIVNNENLLIKKIDVILENGKVIHLAI